MQILMVFGGGEGEYIYMGIYFSFLLFFFSFRVNKKLSWFDIYFILFILYQGKKKGVDRNNHKNWVLIHIFIYQRVFAHLRETKNKNKNICCWVVVVIKSKDSLSNP